MSDTARSSRYEIRVEGVLDSRWTAWFEGLAIGSDDSQTVISGPAADQAALHGLLDRVSDLGLAGCMVSSASRRPGRASGHRQPSPDGGMKASWGNAAVL